MRADGIVVRAATARDAAEVSTLVIATMKESNAAHYAPEVIARVSRNFTSDALLHMIRTRDVMVASADGRIVGTASLDGTDIRSVFVMPDRQGRGIGTRLMAEVLQSAREAGRSAVRVQSTVTAVAFYARLGFETVRDHWHGDERTVVMELQL